MAGIVTDIVNLRKEIKKTEDELNTRYEELGRTAFPWHKAINYVPSEISYIKVSKTYKEYVEISQRVEQGLKAFDQLSSSDKQIGKVQRSMKDLDDSFQTLLSSLGAIAIEIRNAGNFPKKMERFLQPMDHFTEKEEKYNNIIKSDKTPPIMKIIYTSLYKRLEKKRPEVYLEVGKKIYGSGDFRKVPGERAASVLYQMDEIRLLKKNYKKDIKNHQKEISKAEDSLQNLGARGEEARNIKDLQIEKDRIEKRLSELLRLYGQILAKGMNQWMDPEAPQDLKVCYKKITESTDRLKKQNFQVKHLSIEKEIELSENKIVQLSSQVNYLTTQITVLTKQKIELQAKIDNENQEIYQKRDKQNRINAEIIKLDRKGVE